MTRKAMNVPLDERMPHRFNVAEYEAMTRYGIVLPGDRVELIAGEIAEMPVQSPPHAGCVTYLTSFFSRHCDAATVMTHEAMAVLPDSMPAPDVMLLRARDDDYRFRRVEPADVMLLVEVADGSLRYDRTEKLRLYAGAGVSEYWIVDLGGRALEVYRDSRDETYASARLLRPAEMIAPAALPACRVRVGDILGVGS